MKNTLTYLYIGAGILSLLLIASGSGASSAQSKKPLNACSPEEGQTGVVSGVVTGVGKVEGGKMMVTVAVPGCEITISESPWKLGALSKVNNSARFTTTFQQGFFTNLKPVQGQMAIENDSMAAVGINNANPQYRTLNVVLSEMPVQAEESKASCIRVNLDAGSVYDKGYITNLCGANSVMSQLQVGTPYTIALDNQKNIVGASVK